MARIYVGTYAKYNSGSIEGKWLNLGDYSDKEEFEAAARELHADESDPELMFQDWEDIPDGMASESHISEGVWEWLDLDEGDRSMLAAYRAEVNEGGTIEAARDAFQGIYDTEEDFAQELAEDLHGDAMRAAEWPFSCIDWERAARELMMDYSAVRYSGSLYIFRD